MNPGTPTPRDEIEVRLTALLLGELSEEEAAEVRAQMAADEGLAALYVRLSQAIDLVREASALPEPPAAAQPSRLSNERRARLLAHFQSAAPAPVVVRPRRDWASLVPLALAASLIALLGVAVLFNGFGLSVRKGIVEAPDFEASGSALLSDVPAPASSEPFAESAPASTPDGRQSAASPIVATAGAPTSTFEVTATNPVPAEAMNKALESVSKTMAKGSLADARSTASTPAPASRAVATRAFARENSGVPNQSRVSSSKSGAKALSIDAPGTVTFSGTGVPPPSAPAPVTMTAGGFIAGSGTAVMPQQPGQSENRLSLGVLADGSTSQPAPTNAPEKPVGLILNGSNGYAGGTSINGGVLELSKAKALPGAGEVGQFAKALPEERSKSLAEASKVGKNDGGAQTFNFQAGRDIAGTESASALGVRTKRAPEKKSAEASAFFESDRNDLAFKRSDSALPMGAAQPEARQLPKDADQAKNDDGAGASSDARRREAKKEVEERMAGGKARLDEIRTFNVESAKPEPSDEAKERLGKARSERGLSDPVVVGDKETRAPVVGDIPLLGRLMPSTETISRGLVLENQGSISAASADRDGQKNVPLPETPAARADAPLPETKSAPPEPQPEVDTRANAFSTFSLNVSDVAFKLAAASLEQGKMPELATVRSEEFINAFDYRDPEPAAGAPLAFAVERARYPFAQNRDLLRLSVKTAAAGRQPGRPLNLVLLVDNSGSMERADRVSILREALSVLCGQLQPQDKLSVVTFARTPRLWADGVAGDQAAAVTARVSEITPQGGTNLAAALDLGYATALRHYQVGSINRVVLLTDGAANLGDVNPDALQQKVEAHRREGIALDCFGIGWEGLDDTLLEALSRHGDGRYGFINTPEEAVTEFAGQLAGALRVAASDVKVQVEFNPRRVTAYRQIGYAKHQLTKEQFRDNTVDAAEIGAAESGNALYAVEVNPRGEGDLATVRVRFKVPGTDDYREHEWTVPFTPNAPPLEQATPALRLAGAASAFSEWLVTSPYAAEVTPERLLALLHGVPAVYGVDPRPQKLEWMIRQAKSVSGR